MIEIPQFKIYGEDNPQIQSVLKPDLGYRSWNELTLEDKQIAFRELSNCDVLFKGRNEILRMMLYLNYHFLSECPAPKLHELGSRRNHHDSFIFRDKQRDAAVDDFLNFFLGESEEKVMHMLSVWAKYHILENDIKKAAEAVSSDERQFFLDQAYEDFDRLADTLNHILEQFRLNFILTREGFIPHQDVKITTEIYEPVLVLLQDVKWRSVNADLSNMFDDYHNKDYAEVITKAHSAVQRFLQVLVGEEGKNGKGEVGRLFSVAKQKGLIPVNRFTESILSGIQGYLSSERATNSTAKPAMQQATAADALLIMNVVMVFLQHCLSQHR